MHSPGHSWFTRAAQNFVYCKFFERFADYILYIIYNFEAARNFVHLPKFAWYFVRMRQILNICSSCKAGKLRLSNFKSSWAAAKSNPGSCENLTFLKKLHAAASNFYFFIFRTRQLQKSNFTRCSRKAVNLNFSARKF